MALGFKISTPSRHPANQKAYDPKWHRYREEYVNPNSWALILSVNAPWPLDIPFLSFVPENVESYKWTVSEVDGIFRWSVTTTRATVGMGRATLSVPRQGEYKISLETTTKDGKIETETRHFRLRDFLIISIGDSCASGQGNPDIRAVRSADEKLLCTATTISLALPKIRNRLLGFVRDVNKLPAEALENLPYVGKAAAALANGVSDIKDFILRTAYDIASDAVNYVKDGAIIVVSYLEEGVEEVLGWIGIGDGGEKPEPTRPAAWQESRAYRSYKSAPSRAALFIERSSDFSADRVTFLSLARTGSKIDAGLLGPRTVDGKSMDGWTGNRGQIQEAREAIRGRRIDALLISIGGNDSGFSMSLTDLVLDDLWTRDAKSRRKIIGYATDIITNPSKLPARLDELHEAVVRELNPANVYLSEYPVGLFTKFNAAGEVVDGKPGGIFESMFDLDLTVADAREARKVGKLLNQLLMSKAREYRWNYIGGIEGDFDGHGYSASQPYFVSAEESCLNQGDFEGMVHPNDRGLEVIRSHIARNLSRDLLSEVDWLEPAMFVMMR